MQSWTFSVKQKEEEHVLNQSVLLNYLLNSNDPPFFLSWKSDTKGNNYIDHISKTNFPCVTFDVTISMQSEKKGEK